MYPTRDEIQNNVLIKLIDIKNESQIRNFWTETPEIFLKMYYFAWEKDINIDIDPDGKEKDYYNNKIGTIEDIVVSFGGKYNLNCIKIYVEVRDFK